MIKKYGVGQSSMVEHANGDYVYVDDVLKILEHCLEDDTIIEDKIEKFIKNLIK